MSNPKVVKILKEVKSEKFAFREKTLKAIFEDKIKNNECTFKEFVDLFQDHK